MYKRPKLVKLNTEIGLTAIRLAKENNDQMYKKYKKFRKLYVHYRNKILEKYRNKARAKVLGKKD